MADPNMIGSTLGWGAAKVEEGRLRYFAKVTGQLDPVYTDELAARDAGHPALPVPPTYLFCLNSEVCDTEEMARTLNLDLDRILHAEQEFELHRMAYAGDRLNFVTKVADVYEKKGGALLFVANETRVTNQLGEHVADLRCTLVQREDKGGS